MASFKALRSRTVAATDQSKGTPYRVAKRKAVTKSKAKQTPISSAPASSPAFFKIPAELCNHIYDLCAQDVMTVSVPSKGSGNVTSRHGLSATCRQIRGEFDGILSKAASTTAKNIVAGVVDFKFDSLMAFLDRVPEDMHMDGEENDEVVYGLSDEDYEAEIVEKDNKRWNLTVNLTLTASWSTNPDTTALARWFKWLNGKGGELSPLHPTYVFKEAKDKERAKWVMDQVFNGSTLGDLHEPILHSFTGFYNNVASGTAKVLEEERIWKEQAALYTDYLTDDYVDYFEAAEESAMEEQSEL